MPPDSLSATDPRAEDRAIVVGISHYPGGFPECPAQFEPFPVRTNNRCRKDSSHAQSNKVVQNCSSPAGLATHSHNIVNGEVRFNGCLLQSRVDLEIAVQTDIPDQRDTQVVVVRCNLLQTARVHRTS